MIKKFTPVLLLLALTYLPFLNQAFHIDDPLYLEVADNILEKPFFPYDYPALFEGFVAPDSASHSHLPLTSYYLVLVRLATGQQQEWVFHLAFLLFPLLALAGFFDLSRRFTEEGTAATCLLAVSPAFLVLSHTLSPDVPLLAFWLLSLSRFLRIVDGKPSRWDWTLLTVSLLAASFISLLSLGLVLLMAAYLAQAMISGHQISNSTTRRLLMTLGLPFLLWGMWYFRAYLHYDRFVLTNTLLHIDKRSDFDPDLIGLKSVSFLVNVGGVFIFPLALWWGTVDRMTVRIFLLLFLVCFLPFGLGFQEEWEWNWTHVTLFSAFFATGTLILSRFFSLLYDTLVGTVQGEPQRLIGESDGGVRSSFHLGQWSLLVFWFFGILLGCLALFYSGSVRYTLLALPPVIFIWVRELHHICNAYLRRNLIWLAVILTLPYSLAMGMADYQFAQTYRSASAALARDFSREDNTLWFTGEWGFRYYMSEAGAKPLTKTDTSPQPGDIIVKPWVALPSVTLYDGHPFTELIEQRPVRPATPVRILDFFSHAGFYSTGWGLLPFSLSSEERWEWFNVFLVKESYKGPIPEPEPPW